MPETREHEALVEAALQQLKSWPGLAGSPQLANFLNYIVETKLRGDEGSIKAYSIAVDVFGRPQSFDPQSDPIVRVQARRLRAALDEYYAGQGAPDPVRIVLPVGRYVPEFQFRDESAPVIPSSEAPLVTPPLPDVRSRRRLSGMNDVVLYALVLIIGVGIVVVLTQILMPRPTRMVVPRPPSVGIGEFTAISSQQGQAGIAGVAGLAIELVTDLQLFDDINVSYLQGQVSDDDAAAPEYQLAGIARRDGTMVQVTASLRHTGSDTAVWTFTKSVPFDALGSSIDDLSQAFAEQLGSHRGPLFVEANKWLDAHPNIAGNETVFLCGLLFTRYRDTADLNAAARARDCLSSVLAQGDQALALAFRGGLLLDDAAATQPLGLDPEPLGEAGRLISQAVKLNATSSTIWREYGRFLFRAGRMGESEAAYASALQLNPANLDAVAAFGRMLSIRGASQHGQDLSMHALSVAIQAPYWYYTAPAVNALRAGNDSAAIDYAGKLALGDSELASVIGTVAAFRSGYEPVLNRYIAQLLDVTRYRRFGILPVLRHRLLDQALVDEIAAQLRDAGVSNESLNGAF